MSLSLTLAFVWAISANVIAMFPSKHHHWPAAYGLITIGVPLLAYVIYENGPLAGFVVLLAGGSILRWPVRYLFRWLKKQTVRGE